MRGGRIGLEPESATEGGPRLRFPAQGSKSLGQVMVEGRPGRLDRDGLTDQVESERGVAGFACEQAEQVQRVGIPGIDPQDLATTLLGQRQSTGAVMTQCLLEMLRRA